MGTRAGSRPVSEAWRRILPVLLMPRFILVVMSTVLVVIGVFVGLSAAYGALGVHIDSTVTAFLVGFLIAVFLGAVWYVVAVSTGGAASLMGATAERWTAKELASLGPSWRIFHNVPFVDAFPGHTWEVDVDHLVVGPYGVLVVESKFSSSPVDLGAFRLTQRLRDAVRQAKDNAGRISALLRRDAPDVPVRPVVVVWGRLVKAPQDPVRLIETVRVVSGSDALRWRPLLLVQQIVSPQAVGIVSAKVEKLVGR